MNDNIKNARDALKTMDRQQLEAQQAHVLQQAMNAGIHERKDWSDLNVAIVTRIAELDGVDTEIDASALGGQRPATEAELSDLRATAAKLKDTSPEVAARLLASVDAERASQKSDAAQIARITAEADKEQRRIAGISGNATSEQLDQLRDAIPGIEDSVTRAAAQARYQQERQNYDARAELDAAAAGDAGGGDGS